MARCWNWGAALESHKADLDRCHQDFKLHKCLEIERNYRQLGKFAEIAERVQISTRRPTLSEDASVWRSEQRWRPETSQCGGCAGNLMTCSNTQKDYGDCKTICINCINCRKVCKLREFAKSSELAEFA